MISWNPLFTVLLCELQTRIKACGGWEAGYSVSRFLNIPFLFVYLSSLENKVQAVECHCSFQGLEAFGDGTAMIYHCQMTSACTKMILVELVIDLYE